MNAAILVLIQDSIPTLIGAHVEVLLAAGFGLVTAPAYGQEERRLRPDVEVLVEPHLRRHEHAARSPVDALDRLAFLPHQCVAVPAEDDDVDARSVAVGRLVRPDRP